MQIDKKTIRKVFFLVIGSIFVYWLLHETERFKSLWNMISGVLAPFVLGAALAFIFNVPMRAIELRLGFIKGEGLRRTVSIVLTFVLIIMGIYGVIRLLVPQISETVMLLIPKMVVFFQRMEAMAIDFLGDNPDLLNWIYANTGLESLDWSALIQKSVTVLKNSVMVIATGAFSAFGNIASSVVNTVIGLVFSLYALARKEILARQGRMILYSFLPERTSDEIIRVLRLTNATFSNFISGQCLEAFILGCLFALAMAIFGMPYIPLVSVLIGVTALIPVVGAFVGCFLGTFFILVNDPFQALLFVAMFLVIQQLENNLIYPRVVGTSIGLPGMWVLVAVTIGGELMGVAGMLVMIPVVSVCYTLLREVTTRRVEERDIDPDKLRSHPLEVKNNFKENRERREQIRFRRRMRQMAEKYKQQRDAKK